MKELAQEEPAPLQISFKDSKGHYSDSIKACTIQPIGENNVAILVIQSVSNTLYGPGMQVDSPEVC